MAVGDELGILGIVNPPELSHAPLAEVREVRNGATERHHAKAGEGAKHLRDTREAGRQLGRRRVSVVVHERKGR